MSTARACLFIDIYLLFPVLNRLKRREFSLETIASLVYLQTILMQLFAGGSGEFSLSAAGTEAGGGAARGRGDGDCRAEGLALGRSENTDW